MVGPFNADFYQINGMVLESRKRREHLSEEDLQKNKAIMESLTKGSSQGFQNGEVSKFINQNIIVRKLNEQVLTRKLWFSATYEKSILKSTT